MHCQAVKQNWNVGIMHTNFPSPGSPPEGHGCGRGERGVDIHLARGNISETLKREVYPAARGTPRRTRMQGCTSGLGVEGQWDSYGKGITQGRHRWIVRELGDRGQRKRFQQLYYVWFLFVYRTMFIFNLQRNLLASPLTLINPCPPLYGAWCGPCCRSELEGTCNLYLDRQILITWGPSHT
jgi:hypothetical protein